MPVFNGTLNHNAIQNVLFNMIISQRVDADNIKGTYSSLVDKARVDGSLYGDQKLYIATDALGSKPWGADSEASNLLAIDRPAAPATQSIVLKNGRQIRVTVDDYLSKQAFSTEGAFASYNSVVLGWVADTKRIYDSMLYNAFIGTDVSSVGKQLREVNLKSASAGDPLYNLAGVEKEQMEAMLIARDLADLMVEMKDVSRDFNDYQFLRSYSDEEIKVIWNSKFVNKIKKIDIPTIFHKEGLVDKFEEEVLPARFFGTIITSSNVSSYSASTPATGKPLTTTTGVYVPGVNHANGCVRSLVEKDLTISSTDYHVFPGDEIPAGAAVVANGDFELGEVYIEQADVICKIYTELPPIMSAFEVGTSFFNPRALVTNHYLTWLYNDLEHLKGKPCITVKASI